MNRLLFEGWENQTTGELYDEADDSYCAIGWLAHQLGFSLEDFDDTESNVYEDVANHPEVQPIIKFAVDKYKLVCPSYSVLWNLNDMRMFTPEEFLELEKEAKGL